FEAFDLVALSRSSESEAERTRWPIALFPLNACGFIGSSLMIWDISIPIYTFLAGGTLMFAGDALLRALIRPAFDSGDEQLTVERFARGYYASLTAAVILSVAAISQRFTGLRL